MVTLFSVELGKRSLCQRLNLLGSPKVPLRRHSQPHPTAPVCLKCFLVKSPFLPPGISASVLCCVLCLSGLALTHHRGISPPDIPAPCDRSFPPQTHTVASSSDKTKTVINIVVLRDLFGPSLSDSTFYAVQTFSFSFSPWTKCQEVTLNAPLLLFCDFTVSCTGWCARVLKHLRAT